MYEIRFTANALRRFEKLDNETQKRVSAALERIRIRPEEYVERLVGAHLFKLRVGDYRIVLDVKENEIIVITVGHRKNVYDRLYGYSNLKP